MTSVFKLSIESLKDSKSVHKVSWQPNKSLTFEIFNRSFLGKTNIS